MIITTKYDPTLPDVIFDSNVTSALLEDDDSCWEITQPEEGTLDPTHDPEYLERLHIVTVFVVGLCGSLLVLLLLLCACMSNETVAEVLCRRKSHLPNKGIDGYFPFGGVDTGSPVSTPDETSGKNNFLSPEVPILIEPCDAPMMGCDAVTIPLRPIGNSIASDDVSSGSAPAALDDVTRGVTKGKKVEFADDVKQDT